VEKIEKMNLSIPIAYFAINYNQADNTKCE